MKAKIKNTFCKLIAINILIFLLLFNIIYEVNAAVDTYTSLTWNIVNTIAGLAGICCLVIVLVAILKIIMGDEQDKQKYIKRIKNALIGLVLILVIDTVANTVTGYFTQFSDLSEFSIGSYSNTDLEAVFDDFSDGVIYSATQAKEEIQDKNNAINENIYLINGQWYYASFYKEDDTNIGWVAIDRYNVSKLTTLSNLTTDVETYYMTDWWSYCDDGFWSKQGYLVSETTGEQEQFILEIPSITGYVNSDEELKAAILYRIEWETDDDGISYAYGEQDNAYIG